MATWQTGWRSRLVLLASALLVPLLVAGAFVWAGWQSSDRLHHNQGVVVNLDQPVTDKGQVRQLGNQLGAQLVSLSSGQFDWDFGVPAGQAQSGLASGRYSVAVVIPKNFTSALLGNGQRRAVLAIQTSPLASVDQKTMANTLADAAQRGLAKQLGANALSNIYVAFDQVDKNLVTASTKSSDTASAATSLATLATSAKSEAGTLANQTQNVASGSQSVAAAAGQAQKSASDANKSGSAGASAAASANQAANQHQTQAGSAASGASGLGSSVSDAGTGAQSASASAKKASGAASGLGDNSDAIAASATAAQGSMQAYQDAVAKALAQQKDLSSSLAAIDTAADTYGKSVRAFRDAVQGWSKTVQAPATVGPGTLDKTKLTQDIKTAQDALSALAAPTGALTTAQTSLAAAQKDLSDLMTWTQSTSVTVPTTSPPAIQSPTVATSDDLSKDHFRGISGGLSGQAACDEAQKDANPVWVTMRQAEEQGGGGDATTCTDFNYLVEQLSTGPDTLQGMHYTDTTIPDAVRSALRSAPSGILTHGSGSGALATTAIVDNDRWFLPIYSMVLYCTTHRVNQIYGAGYQAGHSTGYSSGYSAGYTDAYQAARAEVAKLAPSADLTTATNDLAAAVTAASSWTNNSSTVSAALTQVSTDADTLAITPGAPVPGASITVTGAEVMGSDGPAAAYRTIAGTQKTLDDQIAAALAADKANKDLATALASDKDPAAVAADLTSLLKANTGEAAMIATVASDLDALQKSLTTLSSSIATAKQQAAAVAKQTASTSTGAAALATQIQALQRQLVTASGAGAGTAAQTAKVATGATQLSKAASTAAKSAGGLSTTVSKVSTQSNDVSKKATDAASSVKGTSTTVKNQTAQQTTTPGQNLTPGTTATTDLSRHPNISWWTPLAALAMWLGAMAMYMLFRPISSALRSSDAGPGTLVGQALAPGLVVGALQGVIMGATSIGVMHLGASDGVKVVGLMLLMAVAFMAVNFVLVALLGIFGRILAVLFAVVTGLGVATNALPETFDRIRNLSPISPALNAVRAVAAGAPGAGAEAFHLLLWAAGALALATLLVLRSRLAAAPRVATAFAN